MLMDNEDMHVIKRDGSKEEIFFDKILKRVKQLGTEANLNINYTSLVIKIIEVPFNDRSIINSCK